MKRRFLLGTLIALSVLAAAQEKEVFAPFVSRLKAAVRGPEIKLTWKDSPDVKGEYLVYRHTNEITAENFKEAVLAGRTEAGKEAFIDRPTERGDYFYAVLSRSPEGKLHDLFIPFRNKTMKAVPLASVGEEKDLAAVISGIRTRVDEGKIEITFKASRTDRELLLYRSTTPILSQEKLSRANIASSFPSSRNLVLDYPVPGIPYYYAVVDAKLLETGAVSLVSGESVSVAYAEIPLAPTKEIVLLPKIEASAGRPMPLPYFLLATELGTGRSLETKEAAGLPSAKPLSPETSKSVGIILASTKPREVPNPEPALLDADRARGGSKDDFTLRTILDGPFAKRDWKETENQLLTFMSLRISEEARARSRFYLGQAYFFQGLQSKGFMELLLASDRHYVETRPWLDAILDFRRLTSRPSEG